MSTVEKNPHGVHMCKTETDSYAVYQIVNTEAQHESFEEVAECLDLPYELVEDAMLYYYDNPYLVHQDALTAQFYLWKSKMETTLESRAKIGQDCPACETGTLTPEHLYPAVNDSVLDYRHMAFLPVVCDRCDYEYQFEESYKGFDEGFQLEKQGEDQLHTIEARLVDFDDATLWYLLRDHSDNSIDHVTHQTLTEDYRIYTGDSDADC